MKLTNVFNKRLAWLHVDMAQENQIIAEPNES